MKKCVDLESAIFDAVKKAAEKVTVASFYDKTNSGVEIFLDDILATFNECIKNKEVEVCKSMIEAVDNLRAALNNIMLDTIGKKGFNKG